MTKIMELNLIDSLYRYFEEQEKVREPQDKITFAPSYLNACGRQIFYKKTGQTPTNPPDLPARFKMHFGTLMHTEIQRMLSEIGHLESFEEFRTTEYEGLVFNYFYDGILNVEGERHIMEIKTIYGAGFDAIKENPKEDHLIQAVSYMVFEKIPRAVILYIGRDNGYMVQHHLRAENKTLFVNDKDTNYLRLWKDKIQKMKELVLMIEAGVLPERDFQIVLKNSKGIITDNFQYKNEKYKSDWNCNYCSFKDLCWQKEFEQIKNHNFYIGGQFI